MAGRPGGARLGPRFPGNDGRDGSGLMRGGIGCRVGSLAADQEPGRDPGAAEQPAGQKAGTPPVAEDHDGQQGAAGQQPDADPLQDHGARHAALLDREPVVAGVEGGRQARALAEPEQDPAHDEHCHRLREEDRDLRRGPDQRQRENEPLHRDAADHEQADEDARQREQEEEAAADEAELPRRERQVAHHGNGRQAEDQLVEEVQGLEQEQHGEDRDGPARAGCGTLGSVKGHVGVSSRSDSAASAALVRR